MGIAEFRTLAQAGVLVPLCTRSQPSSELTISSASAIHWSMMSWLAGSVNQHSNLSRSSAVASLIPGGRALVFLLMILLYSFHLPNRPRIGVEHENILARDRIFGYR